MNFRLSCYSDRGKHKSIFVLEREGAEVASYVVKTKTDNIKVNVLDILLRGIRYARNYLSHEDTLIIEIQNRHLAHWVQERTEDTGYTQELEAVFTELETVDCRYKVIFTPTNIAKKVLNSRSVNKPKLSDIMEGIE